MPKLTPKFYRITATKSKYSVSDWEDIKKPFCKAYKAAKRKYKGFKLKIER